MNQHTVTTIALRCLGVYCIITCTSSLQIILSFVVHANSNDNVNDFWLKLYYLAPHLTLLFMGLGLIKYAGSVASWFSKAEEDPLQASQASISNDQLRSVAYSSIGLWLIIDATPTLGQAYAHYHFSKTHAIDYAQGDGLAYWLPKAIAPGIELVLGLLLFFGARGLVGFWNLCQKMRPMKR